MKNENQNSQLKNTFKLARETFEVNLDGHVHSSNFGDLGHMEDIVEIAKWFSDIFAIMDEIEDGLTDLPSELS